MICINYVFTLAFHPKLLKTITDYKIILTFNKNSLKIQMTFLILLLIFMKKSDLIKHWDMPDNSRLTSKQLSFRLPVHVAAKINALTDLFPTKTRTEIIGDLLTEALDGIENSFKPVKGEFAGHSPEGEEDFYDIGRGSKFRELANKYYAEFESELGNEDSEPLYTSKLVITEDDL